MVRKTELISVEPIQDIIELALWTSYVKGCKPVSLMIVAEPESGKTEIMKKYRNNDGVFARRRFTAFGIQRDLIDGKIHVLFERPMILGHILIYDFASLYSFKMNTIDSTRDFLDALTEEGLAPETTYAMSSDALKEFEGLKGGLIAGINTLGFFTPKKKRQIKINMLKGGFFSRNVFVSYGMSELVLHRIFDSVKSEEYRVDKKFVNLIPIRFPRRRTDVRITDTRKESLKELVYEIREELASDLEVNIKGIRLFKSIIALAKASALRDGRNRVNDEDIDRLTYLSNWMNLRMRSLKRKYPFN